MERREQRQRSTADRHHSTPLYAMLGTGDTVPAWVWICGSCGLLALALAILLGKRKRRTN